MKKHSQHKFLGDNAWATWTREFKQERGQGQQQKMKRSSLLTPNVNKIVSVAEMFVLKRQLTQLHRFPGTKVGQLEKRTYLGSRSVVKEVVGDDLFLRQCHDQQFMHADI